MEIVGLEVSAVTLWPYWVQLLVVMSLAAVLVCAWIADEKYAQKALIVLTVFVAAFALHLGFYSKQGVAALFFTAVAGGAGIIACCRPLPFKVSYRYSTTILIIFMVMTIVVFGVFRNVFFDEQIYINQPFRLYFSVYTQWLVFAVLAAIFLTAYVKRSARSVKLTSVYACSLFILSFWLVFVGVKVLDKQNYVSAFLFDDIMRGVHLGFGVDAKNSRGETKLHLAILAGDIKEVERLIDLGAGVDEEGTRVVGRRTPLAYAMMGKHYDIFMLLLDKGSNVSHIDQDGTAPLHIAAGQPDIRYLNALLSRGANVSQSNKIGRQPLHIASESSYNIRQKRFFPKNQFIRRLVEHGADINAQGRFGTPLHHAVFGANITAFKELLRLGADRSLRNKEGRTPLEMAQHLNNSKLQTASEVFRAKSKNRAKIIELCFADYEL